MTNPVAFFSIPTFFSKIRIDEERRRKKVAKQVEISTEFITLGQFLKLADVISTGGMAKWFLSEHEVFVNGEPENRRGKKLVNNDLVEIPEFGKFIVKT